MNSPNPVPQVQVPASTPTIGALLGSIIASAVAVKVGADPVTQGAVVTGITTFTTWLAHFLHSKLGTPE